MKTIANTFVKGLLFTLPVVITFGLLYWLLATAEGSLKVPLEWLLPEGWYVTGLGVASAIAIIFGIGVLAQAYLINGLFNLFERLLTSIPIVKTLYSNAKDLMMFFAPSQDQQMSRVVKVTFDSDIQLIGFVTNEGVDIGESKDQYAVFFPMSYQMGGYLAYMPKDRCEILDIPVQKAMQQVLTAHIKKNHQKN